MTEAEILALAEPKTESTPVEKEATPVETAKVEEKPKPAKAEFPPDTPQWAIDRINKLSGQRAGAQTLLEQERKARADLERKLQEEQAARRKAEAELPIYQRSMVAHSKAYYDEVDRRAEDDLKKVFTTGDMSGLKQVVNNIVATKMSRVELDRAEKEIPDPATIIQAPAQPEAPKDFFDVLESQKRTAVPKNVFFSDSAQFAIDNGIDWNAPEGTPAALKKNAALQLDKSAVQLGHLVGSRAYWRFMEDGLRRAVPEDGRASGNEHTETGSEPQRRQPAPSVAAPAARATTSANNGARTKIVLNETDRNFLKRNPKMTEADIIREKQRMLDNGERLDD